MRRLLRSLQVAGMVAGLLAASTLLRATEPIPSFCDVASRPDRFADQVVTVRAQVMVGFEVSLLVASGCASRLWLEMPGAGPRAMVGGGGGCRGRVVPDVSAEQFIALAGSGAFKVPENLPWKEIPAPAPLQHVPSKQWQRFVEKVNKQVPKRHGVVCIDCPRYTVTATLRGRLEYQPNGCVKAAADGKFDYYSGGFGHLNAYPARLVVSDVVDFVAEETTAAKP